MSLGLKQWTRDASRVLMIALGNVENKDEGILTNTRMLCQSYPHWRTENRENERFQANVYEYVSNRTTSFHNQKGWPEGHKSSYLVLEWAHGDTNDAAGLHEIHLRRRPWLSQISIAHLTHASRQSFPHLNNIKIINHTPRHLILPNTLPFHLQPKALRPSNLQPSLIPSPKRMGWHPYHTHSQSVPQFL